MNISKDSASAYASLGYTPKKYSWAKGYLQILKAKEISPHAYVDIGRKLTYSKAVKEVVKGRSVFTVTRYEAKAVAIAAGGKTGRNNKQLLPEIDKGKKNVPGYYYHYHTYNRKGGHVYYLF